ncbi:hypothetical protein [Pseudomonas fluorescens]|uniref:hypothetical protein n=1 Tax=Pseudomonas fluorescens TaxID=294 RepID=UPI0020C2BDC4|nr:hypothetical protein [Pseudomonas fluorescens]UTL92003.1 hypothetical protein NLL86_04475 [Pseudomonas fluorescens]
MVDFISSLEKGLDAAKQAESNKTEIRSVFGNLNKQLLSAFDGKLEIHIYTKTNPFAALVGISGGQAKPDYQFIGAKNPLAENKDTVEIAGWKLDPNGYPCKIISDDAEIYCENKEALEQALQHLLSRPDVGEKLYSLMKRTLKTN